MECFHTLCLIRSSFCCIDLCIVIRVRILSIVVSAACIPHIKECTRIIVVTDPSVTCDLEVTILSVLKEYVPVLVVQVNSYAKFFLPHVLECFSDLFVFVICVVQIFNCRETFAVWISCICKDLTCFFTVLLIIIFRNAVIFTAYCTEVISACSVCIIDTGWNISCCRNFTGLSYVIYDVVTIDYK